MKPREAAQKAMDEFNRHVRSMSKADYAEAAEELFAMAEAESNAATEQLEEDGED